MKKIFLLLLLIFLIRLPLRGEAVTASGIVTDAQGKPAAGVEVAFSWRYRDQKLVPYRSTTTNQRGRFNLHQDSYRRPLALLAIDRKQEYGGLVIFDEKSKNKKQKIQLEPLVHLFGTLKCGLLGDDLGWTRVLLCFSPPGIDIVSTVTEDGTFSLKVPPGDYHLVISGKHLKPCSKSINATVENRECDLGCIDVKPSKLALHYGKASPELDVTDALGVDKGVKIADYRGKWLLLHFGSCG